MIFSQEDKYRLKQIEELLNQMTCLHRLEDRVFDLTFSGNPIFIEKCHLCRKIIHRFDNEIDWNKARIEYMKARIKELEKSVAEA